MPVVMGSPPNCLPPQTRAFYRHVLDRLQQAGIPFLVGGAYALNHYTGIERHTKDFDVFITRADVKEMLRLLVAEGYQAELTFPHWLGKAYNGEDFIDIVFASGNGIARVDDEWFSHAVEGQALDVSVLLCPVEEIIWSKAYIMERERFDGGDIAHLLLHCAARLDWERLLRRFGPDWRVFLAHLMLFGFIYPGERVRVPAWVMQRLCACLQEQGDPPVSTPRVCQGTLLSREQYLVDLDQWGYKDARLARGTLTPDEIAKWTAAIDWTKTC
jgi:hypothetical protein